MNTPLKSFPLLLLFVCITPVVFSQTKFGLSAGGTAAGFNYQQAISNPSYSDENKIGANAGLKMEISFRNFDLLKLTPEIFFNQNGTKDEYYNSWAMFQDSLVANNISLDYIGIYFPLKINLRSKDGAGIYFLGSVYADYTIRASITSSNWENQEVIFNTPKDRLDYGYRVALGLMPGEGFGVEIGYNKGIQNIEFSTKLNSGATNYLINNKGLTVSLVALF